MYWKKMDLASATTAVKGGVQHKVAGLVVEGLQEE